MENVLKKILIHFPCALANFFNDKTAAEYKKELQQAYKKKDRYYPLKKKLSFEEYKELQNISVGKTGKK